MVWQPEVDEIERRREMALEMGRADRVRDQHERGKLTVRERIGGLLDEGATLMLTGGFRIALRAAP